MPQLGIFPLSDALDSLEVKGRTWCLSNMSVNTGLSILSSNAVIFHAVLDGLVWIHSTGGVAQQLASGDAIAILPGQTHALQTHVGAKTLRCAFLNSEQRLPTPLIRRIGDGKIVSRVLSGRLSCALPADAKRQSTSSVMPIQIGWQGAAGLRDALTYYMQGDATSVLLTRFAGVLLADSLRHHIGGRLKSNAGEAGLERIRMIMENSPQLNWSVAALAREAAMSRSAFAMRFGEFFGMPPMAYLTHIRMEMAKKLLNQSSISIGDIAEAVGYSSEVAFVRRFTAAVGMTPSAFRHQSHPSQNAPSSVATSSLLLGPRPNIIRTHQVHERDIRHCRQAERMIGANAPPKAWSLLRSR